MITDWRGKELKQGDLVVFSRGDSSWRHFAVGRIVEFLPEFDTYKKQRALLVQVVEQSSNWQQNKRPSKILLKHATKVEP